MGRDVEDGISPEVRALFEPDEAARKERRRNHLAWLVVGIACVIAFELTADPAYSIVLGCLKYGWDEFRGAQRVGRLDPDRKRGRTCARFLTAFGFWKVSLVAVALIFLSAFLLSFVHARAPKGVPAPPPREIMTAMLVAVVGFFLSALASLAAVFAALRYRVKVWVGRGRNRVKDMLLTVSLVVGTPVVLLLVAPVLALAGQVSTSLLVLAMFLLVMFLYPFVLLTTLDRLTRAIMATRPSECWPELLLPVDQRPRFLAERLFPYPPTP